MTMRWNDDVAWTEPPFIRPRSAAGACYPRCGMAHTVSSRGGPERGALLRCRRVGLDVDVSSATAAAIATATATARAAWPQLDVGPTVEASFADALRAIVGDGEAEVKPSAAIAALHVGDLWLATACGEGHPAAITQLDAVLATLRPTLARMGAEAAGIDDLLQQLRERLLTGAADRPPRIRGYRGRGELRSWLKVALVRDATRALQRELGRTPVDELDQLMDPGPDVELAAMKDGYRLAFGVAFASALGELGARDRNVLRYHLVEGLSIDEIGALFRVHRSTAARWLVAIREGLFDATRRALMRQLALGPADVDSVLRMIRSRLDASLATGLDATP